ncbi:hypothetical protein [Streptomyces sp. AC550_RSS872]|uniref:hypothetical protein n=1 Tax=Streptomyces sp. AC550_RSS872 TaxID=2823689 RepID=UPI001C27978B|nr:hypothetical protein [Streptomyces sp. AC550_RSS872]
MDESLSFENFLEGAKKAAHRAMDDHGRGEYDEFALHGGVAVERLAKAVLVSKNPVYLLEMRNGNPDMLLYLGGHLEMSADKVRTVGAKDTIKRLRTLGLLPPDSELDLLIELRNGTAHTTIGDQAKTLLPTLAKNIAALLKDIDLPEENFWGRWTSAMNVAVDKRRGDIERDVQLRIRQARHGLDDRLKGLPLPYKLRVPGQSGFSVFFQDANPDIDQVVVTVTGTHGCPACERQAIVKAEPDPASPKMAFTAVSMSCPWCQLRLNSAEEIQAAGTNLASLVELAGLAAYDELPDSDNGTQES